MASGFVDIHSHILPGVDDGSGSLEESLEMLEVAIAAGTSDIVATPHASPQYAYDSGLVQSLRGQLQEAVGNRIRIHLGCDFHFTFDNVQQALASPAAFSINGAGYLMVEFSDLNIPPNTELAFSQLQAKGLVPVVTHPERNALLRATPQRLRQWVESGSLLQVTAQSLLGRFGPEAQSFSRRLVREGLAHFVASDAHDPFGRPPRLDEAFRFLTGLYGEIHAGMLLREFPAATLTGRRLDPGPVPTPPPAKKWFQFWL